jgi:hypothetical protein
MAEKYFFEERNAKKAASKARTTARDAAKTRATKKAAPTKQLKQTNLDKTAGSRSKSGASTAAAVGKRFGITAREARDIATALGTVAGRAITGTCGANDPTAKGKAAKNLVKQIKETGVAAATGKKGTTSDIEGRQYEKPKGSGRYKVDRTYGYEKGKKRK